MFTFTPADAGGGIDTSRRHQIFPCLSEDQFVLLGRYGDRRRFPRAPCCTARASATSRCLWLSRAASRCRARAHSTLT